MSEYIDKEKLLQKLSRMIEYCKNDNKVNGLTALFQVGDAIMDCPTADVVEVVRCKDCAVPHNQWTGCPKLNGLVTPPDFYCSYGNIGKKVEKVKHLKENTRGKEQNSTQTMKQRRYQPKPNGNFGYQPSEAASKPPAPPTSGSNAVKPKSDR